MASGPAAASRLDSQASPPALRPGRGASTGAAEAPASRFDDTDATVVDQTLDPDVIAQIEANGSFPTSAVAVAAEATARSDDRPITIDDPDAIEFAPEATEVEPEPKASSVGPAATPQAGLDPDAFDMTASAPIATEDSTAPAGPPPATAVSAAAPFAAPAGSAGNASGPGAGTAANPIEGLAIDSGLEESTGPSTKDRDAASPQTAGDGVDLDGLSELAPADGEASVAPMDAAPAMGADLDPIDAGLDSTSLGGGVDIDLSQLPSLAEHQEEVRPASLAPVERMRRAMPRKVEEVKNPRLGRAANLGVTGVGLVLLTLGLLRLAAGSFDPLIRLLTPGSRFAAAQGGQGGGLGVQLRWMRSQLYPTRAGANVLVMYGEVANASGKPLDDLWAVGELRGGPGPPVLSQKAPAGVALRPPELYGLTDSVSLEAAFVDRTAALGPQGQRLESGGTAAFSVVFLKPPRRLRELQHTVRFERGTAVGEPQDSGAVQGSPDLGDARPPDQTEGGAAQAPGDSAAVPPPSSTVTPRRRGRRAKRRRGRLRSKGPGMR